MHSQNFRKAVQLALKITSFSSCTPFSYDSNLDKLMVTRSKAKIGVFLIQLLTLHIFTCHLYFQIWFSREYFVKNLSDSSVHIFYALCWIGFTAYKRNFWEKGKSVCWLYNEVSKINGRYRSKIHMN